MAKPQHLGLAPAVIRRRISGCNRREQDTIDQLRSLRSGMESKRLTYKALIKDNGLKSDARGVAVA